MIRKTSILFVAFSFITLTTFAQLGLGIKAGANFSNIDFEDIDTESKTGFHFGAFANLKLGDTYAIQPELLYSTIGAEFDGADDIDFDYLTIPVLLQANFSILNLYAGPQIGFITDVTSDGLDKDDFKSVDWSMVLGAGIDLPLNLELGGRYVYGISDVSDVPDLGDVNNHTWQIYVSMQLFGSR